MQLVYSANKCTISFCIIDDGKGSFLSGIYEQMVSQSWGFSSTITISKHGRWLLSMDDEKDMPVELSLWRVLPYAGCAGILMILMVVVTQKVAGKGGCATPPQPLCDLREGIGEFVRTASTVHCRRGAAPAQPARTSRYNGVNWNKHGQKWMARITENGKQKYLGLFADEADAARAYDTKARPLGLRVNFQEDSQGESAIRGSDELTTHFACRTQATLPQRTSVQATSPAHVSVNKSGSCAFKSESPSDGDEAAHLRCMEEERTFPKGGPSSWSSSNQISECETPELFSGKLRPSLTFKHMSVQCLSTCRYSHLMSIHMSTHMFVHRRGWAFADLSGLSLGM